jgi:hypothetical protein
VPTAGEIRAAVDGYVAAYNQDDREAFLALWAPDAVGSEAAMVFEIQAAGMVIEAVDVFAVDEDGKVASMRAYWDMTTGRPAP